MNDNESKSNEDNKTERSLQPSIDNEHLAKPDDYSRSEYPPDSAYGWVIVGGAFFTLMLSIGTTTTYGVYLQEYTLNIFPDASSSLLSWIGTLQFASICFFGIAVGVLCEYYDTRLLSVLGALISGIAYIIASFCNSPWKLLITQGILYGFGSSLLYITGLTLPPQWFTKYRAIATAVALCGSGLGGLWLSFATRAMIKNLGYKWALRITGFVIIGICGPSSFLMRMRITPARREKIIDFSILKQPRFLLLFFASMFGNGGYYIPYYFIPSFSSIVLNNSQSWGTNLSSIMNGAGIVGRIFSGLTADRIGPLNTLIISTTCSCLSVLVLWLPFKHSGTLIACSVLFGFFSASIVSVLPVVTAKLFGIERLPMIMGLLMVSYMIGGLIASPPAGEMLDRFGNGTSFSSLIIYDGAMLGAGVVFEVILRVSASKNLFKKI